MPSLDGLRGLAALAVVVFHAMSAFVPWAVPDQSETVPRWADSPLEVLCNGPFWVFVFFVLSGFVLARASRAVRRHFWRDVALRYLRLALPATASVLLAWALLSMFPMATSRLDRIAPSPWFRWVVQGHIPSVAAALKDGLFGIFRNGYSYFNNVLWTMRIEAIGSLCVYGFFQLCRRHRAVGALVVLAASIAARVPAGYVAFGLGAGLWLAFERGRRLPGPAALLVFVLGLLVGGAARGFADRHGLAGWPMPLQPGRAEGLAYPLGALAVVAGVLGSRPLQLVFECEICQWLGRLSFPLYLVHVPLLYTLVAAAAIGLAPLSATRIAALGTAFLALAFALAWLFEKTVDQPVLALNRRLAGTKRRR